MGAAPTLGFSSWGDEKRLLELVSTTKEGQFIEDGGSAFKPKRRELKNFETLMLEAMALAGVKGFSRVYGSIVGVSAFLFLFCLFLF